MWANTYIHREDPYHSHYHGAGASRQWAWILVFYIATPLTEKNCVKWSPKLWWVLFFFFFFISSWHLGQIKTLEYYYKFYKQQRLVEEQSGNIGVMNKVTQRRLWVLKYKACIKYGGLESSINCNLRKHTKTKASVLGDPLSSHVIAEELLLFFIKFFIKFNSKVLHKFLNFSLEPHTEICCCHTNQSF